jgi:hypothetical protein
MNSALLTIPKIALLDGVSPSFAWRKAWAGEYGPLTRKNGRGHWLVSIAEVERRRGVKFSPEQIEQAARAPAQVTGTKQKAHAAAIRERARKHPLPNPVMLASLVAARDRNWRDWSRDSAARQTHPRGPPADAVHAIFKSYELYTREQLEDAIRNALDERDAEWKRWSASSIERAISPFAPRRGAL